MNILHNQQSNYTQNLSVGDASLVRVYLNKVYLWMSVALMSTAIVAAYTSGSHETMTWLKSGFNSFIVVGASVAIVLVMIFAYNKLSSGALTMLFLGYSALTGLVFGPIISMYTQQSLALAFGCTAGTFGAMSLYGAFTKKNLSTVGRAARMMLIGLFITMIANYFFASSTLDLIISLAGIGIFSALTAYHTQKLIEQGGILGANKQAKPAVMGALTLYLDFINLFLFMLRFLGREK